MAGQVIININRGKGYGIVFKHCNSKRKRYISCKKYLRLIAESSNNFGIEPGECIIRPASKGTLVQLNSPYGYKELASALSVQSKGEVLLCYIYDDDFWGYHLYNNGEEAGCFCPIPDYFGDMDEEEALSMSAGDAEILSCIF